ncbi:phosphoglycerate dehydrogenase [Effusibacillus dendaii]|uniref:D-3-phosphoglycerate dehydrogenase n=1 Tax=Effusibacillus dendaii TaxID=2743772 RepID=A0A7I8D711_9BACL|nr:phosphoglycerate dehydrogenase [Effusibacillus dendaii]BCJ85874.1 phosphoglycerate dehydrogenase [Effusibacillus dendaii]
MIRVLVSDPISEQGLGKLLEAEDIVVEKKTGLSEDELCAIIAEYDALLVRSQTKVTAKIMEHGTRLRVIGRAGVGVDNIDVPAATQRGIVVLNAPDGNTISTAEHTFAMMISMARKIPQAYASILRGEWDRKTFVGVELNNKVLGILGLGRIGTEVAKRAQAFGMKVLAYDPFLTPQRANALDVQQCTVDEIVVAADFITVHTPLIKETKYLISEREFGMMKDGVRILNCARGGIIKEEALIEALKSGKVAGAALDVYEEEPLAKEHPLKQFPNVVLTPHLGASTEEAQINVAIDVAEEVLKVLRDEPFRNAVNLPSLPADKMKQVEPYLALGENIGKMAAQLVDDPVTKIEISYSGDISNLETAPITRTLLKGFLSYHHGEEVNFVNAPLVAEQAGIQTIETKTSKHSVFTNLIGLEVTTATQTKRIAGTLNNGFGPRIVRLDGYAIDAAPEGRMIVTSHLDQPGMIGRIGMILADANINIATMQVGRKEVGGKAVMVLGIDNPAGPEVVRQLAEIPNILEVHHVEL